MNKEISVEVEIRETVDVSVSYSEVICSIRHLPAREKWNYFAIALNQINPQNDLTAEDRGTVIRYLEMKLKELKTDNSDIRDR